MKKTCKVNTTVRQKALKLKAPLHAIKKRGPFVTTYLQAKRLVKIVVGFTIVAVGFVMLVTPGPGLAAIVIGLAVLGTEFVWARKLMKRFEHEARNAKNSFVNNYFNNKKK